MNGERAYPLLLALFVGTVVCVAMPLAHWLTASFIPVEWICCPVMAWPAETTLWRAPLARGAALILLMFVLGELGRRWWMTQRFVAQLNSWVMDDLPPRLARLFDRLDLPRPPVVLITDVPLAFCLGWLRPRICLSTGLADSLSDDELLAVLWHEEHHRRATIPCAACWLRRSARPCSFCPSPRTCAIGFSRHPN